MLNSYKNVFLKKQGKQNMITNDNIYCHFLECFEKKALAFCGIFK